MSGVFFYSIFFIAENAGNEDESVSTDEDLSYVCFWNDGKEKR